MTFYDEFKGKALQAYKEMVAKMVEKAMNEFKASRDQIVVRPLRPTDLGGTDISTTAPYWQFGFSGGDAAWSTISASGAVIADNRFVGISGVFHNEAVTDASQVKITRSGSVARYWDTLPIRTFKHKTGFADDPVTIDQNMSLTIQAYSRTASTTNEFGFIGATVEKRGLLINP